MTDFASALQGLPDEAVEVNQRALIDKVLARYSGENTVYRELLQNADDATAGEVEIKFLTETTDDGGSSSSASENQDRSGGLPDLSSHKISRVIVRNDGIPFRDQDWARLRKIAEGNPDESKIGAFGVGFYALWSICDSPIVLSGPSIMGFNWSTKNPDQLVTRRGINPSPSHWTTFVMDLRSPVPMQAPFEFSRFLATSLAFTTQIKTISLYFDHHLLCKLEKKLAPPQPLSTPTNLNLTTPMQMMKIQSVQQTSTQIDAQILKWTLLTSKPKVKATVRGIASSAATSTSSFATRMLSAFTKQSSSTSSSSSQQASTTPEPADNPSNLLTSLKASLFLRIVSGNVNVSVPNAFSAELERATKKPPPKKTQYDLIWTNKDEFDAGKESTSSGHQSKSKLLSGDETARAVFDGLISDLDVQGRVFIGFPTHQTTGFSGSIAARFIPTVERESLDLQARYVADWNKELLAIGGILARVVYESEMKEIQMLWKNTDKEEDGRKWLTSRALHALQFFTYYSSTPASTVSIDAEESFFKCDRNRTLTVPSSLGPLPANKVRLPSSELVGFIREIPVLASEVAKEAPVMIGKLRERRLIAEISLEDVFKELENRVLNVDEMRECMNWWISLAGYQGYDRSLVMRFLRCGVFKYEISSDSGSTSQDESNEVIMSLSNASTFINIKTIPSDISVPTHCLPFCLTKSINGEALRRVFGFQELSMIQLTTHLFTEPDTSKNIKQEHITQSPILAERYLNILSKGWNNLRIEEQEEICGFLKDKSFIPTRHGIKKSSDAYHSNVNLFQDLAVVCLPSGNTVKGTLEKVLTAIGVRKHVELQMVFSRLLGSGEWNHADLVKYLVSVRDTLTELEIDRLRHTSWLPREGEPKIPLPPGPDGTPRRPKTNRYTASQLYEPSTSNQELGLPIVEWPGKWKSMTDEAKLLFFLGLKNLPEIDILLNIAAATKEEKLREKALKFFLEHFSDYRNNYRPGPQTPAFIPCENGACFKPLEVYSNPKVKCMGFNVLKQEYMVDYQKFGINQNPSSQELLKRLLESPPKDVAKATEIFEYLSSRVSDFSTSELQTMKNSKFIPVKRSKEDIHVSPGACFFQAQESVKSGIYKSLFTYIDFGTSSKPFLSACGVKNEPTVQEITEMLIADPVKFYNLAGSAEEYLQVLRNIAANGHLLSSSLRRSMQNSAFILGTRRVGGNNLDEKKKIDEMDEDEDEIEAGQPFVHVLVLPRDVVIIDDSHSYSQFTTIIVACPQEEVFEQLAESLGASRLTRLVKESFRIERTTPEENERTEEMRKLLVERTALFLHERQTGGRNEVIRDSEWLKRNLTVKQVEKVSLQRELVYMGVKHSSVLQSTATASIENRSRMILYLVRKTEIDWFELASSVCKLILSNQKLSDSLFFMTILQTSLKNLKRRGMNVDRIINARKAEREAAQERLRERKLQEELDEVNGLTDEQIESQAKEIEKKFPDAEPGFIRESLKKEKDLNRVIERFSHGAYDRKLVNQETAIKNQEVSKTQSGIFSSLRRKLLNNENGINSEPLKPNSVSQMSGSLPHQPTIEDSSRPKTSSIRPPVQATPMTDIRSNLIKAINFSKADNNKNIDSKIVNDPKPIKESGEGYCNSKSSREELMFLSVVKGIRFYISKQIGSSTNSGELVLMEYGDALNRYIEKIIKPIGEIFGIDPKSLHVFYDLEGPVIAFNRSGSLFFNLRYYLAWYDEQVKNDRLSEALIGTFSTFAHELAHNLVEAHNSEHEWWMSAFVEQYFLRVANYITSISTSVNLIDN